MKFLLSLLVVGVVSAKSRRSQAEPEEKTDLAKEVWGVETPEETGVFVPYDKTLPNKEGVRYYTASGYQECQLCLNLLGTYFFVVLFFLNDDVGARHDSEKLFSKSLQLHSPTPLINTNKIQRLERNTEFPTPSCVKIFPSRT